MSEFGVECGFLDYYTRKEKLTFVETFSGTGENSCASFPAEQQCLRRIISHAHEKDTKGNKRPLTKMCTQKHLSPLLLFSYS